MELKLDFKPVKSWKTDISRDSPEIVCISRPFIEQALYRSQFRNPRSNDSPEYATDLHIDWMSSFMHSDHHHGHDARLIETDILKGKEDLVEKGAIFQLKPSLKYRSEQGGSLVSEKYNVYFVNDNGVRLASDFSKPFAYEDISKLSSRLGLPEEGSRDFFKKLLVFDLLTWTQ